MKARVLFPIVLLACLSGASSPAWHFLPTFHEDVRGVEFPPDGNTSFFTMLPHSAARLLKRGTPLTAEQRRELYWRPASFPHRDFVRLMPEEKVFGWYGCEFEVPKHFAGRDLALDLGIIDDSDETFLNGRRIGGMGKIPDGSAWRSDRLYRIPAELVRPRRNYLAVHVWSKWGLGGIVGPPVLKAALAPPEARWELAFAKDCQASQRGLNAARTLEGALAFLSSEKPLVFEAAPLPWTGYAVWPSKTYFAVFRLAFDLKSSQGKPMRLSKDAVIDMGPVFDVAAFYLNGARVGRTGRFPENGDPAFTEAATRARFIVEKGHWREDGHNELVAVVYRERGVGGLPGMTGILFDNPVDLKRNAPFAQVAEAFDTLLQSDQIANAEKLRL